MLDTSVVDRLYLADVQPIVAFQECGWLFRQIDSGDSEEVIQYQEFRHELAVEKYGWVEAPDPRSPREYDVFDPYSIHFGGFNYRGLIDCYVRGILPSPVGLQVTTAFGDKLNPVLFNLDPERAIEVSRLLVREGINHTAGQEYTLAQCLYKALYQWCILNKKTQWFLVAEKRYIRALQFQHFPLQIIGEGMFYEQATCYPAVMELERAQLELKAKAPEAYRWFNKGLPAIANVP